MKSNSKTYVPGHENNGGGDKLITRYQIYRIENLAYTLGKTAQIFAAEIYKKSIVQLIGREAHELIQLLEAEVSKQGLEMKCRKRKRYVKR